jgi:hypothetical protein
MILIAYLSLFKNQKTIVVLITHFFHDISYYLSQWQISHLHHNGFLIFEQRLVNIFFFKSRKNDTK